MASKKSKKYPIETKGKNIHNIKKVYYESGSKQGWNLVFGIRKEKVKPTYKAKLKSNWLYRSYKLKTPSEDITPIIRYVEDTYLTRRKPSGKLTQYKKGYQGVTEGIPKALIRKSAGYRTKIKRIRLEQDIDKIWGTGIGRVRIEDVTKLDDNSIFGYNRTLIREAMKQGDLDILNFVAQEENMRKTKIRQRILHNIEFISEDAGGTRVIAEASMGNVTIREVQEMLKARFPSLPMILESPQVTELRKKGFKVNVLVGSAIGIDNLEKIRITTQLSARRE